MRTDGHTRKILCFFVLAILLSLACTRPASAANCVNDIEMQAVVQDDGSLSVRQTWVGDFSEGTELYIPLHLPSYAKLREFYVADESEPFSVLDKWEVDASLAQKAQKCGAIKTEDGYELCFGIGKYGQRSFRVDYTLENAIGSYTDFDGASYAFVNQEMNTTPTNVMLEIRLANGTPITEDNCKAWGFGYDGSLQIKDGIIRVETTSPIQKENYVTVMLSFSKGLLYPERTESGSFETVKKEALASNAKKSGKKLPFLLILIGVTGLVAAALCIRFLLRWRKQKKIKKVERRSKEHAYRKDLPNEGNRNATYVLGQFFQLCDKEACLKMGLLRLINLGCIVSITEGRSGFLGKGKHSLKLQHKAGSAADELDLYLYRILEEAAGAELLLKEEMLPAAAKQCETRLRTYLDMCEKEGRQYLMEKNCVTGFEASGKLKSLRECGRSELKETLGFRQYLQDFSQLAERGEQQEGFSWRDCLGYAILFGNANSLIHQMREVYPHLASELEQYRSSVSMAETFAHVLYGELKNGGQRKTSEQMASSVHRE